MCLVPILLSQPLSSINTSWYERYSNLSCTCSSRRSALRSFAMFRVTFLRHSADLKALLRLKRDTSTSNSLRRKAAISVRRIQGRSASRSERAVNILGVMVLGLPVLLGGARVVPKRRRIDRIVRTVRVEQPAVAAILSSLGDTPSCDLLRIISRISRCCDSAMLGAIGNTST